MTAWTHHDPAVRRLIREAQAVAYLRALQDWHEGDPDHECGGECFRESMNPYREETQEGPQEAFAADLTGVQGEMDREGL